MMAVSNELVRNEVSHLVDDDLGQSDVTLNDPIRDSSHDLDPGCDLSRECDLDPGCDLSTECNLDPGCDLSTECNLDHGCDLDMECELEGVCASGESHDGGRSADMYGGHDNGDTDDAYLTAPVCLETQRSVQALLNNERGGHLTTIFLEF